MLSRRVGHEVLSGKDKGAPAGMCGGVAGDGVRGGGVVGSGKLGMGGWVGVQQGPASAVNSGGGL